MSSKLPLPARFTDNVMAYSLVYIPGLSDDAEPRYSLEPNTSGMLPIGSNVQQVNIQEKGKMFFTWVMMQQPAKPGTTVPARQFLFFRLSERPIPLDLLHPGSMICYAATPLRATADPAQSFVDSLFGQVVSDTQSQRPKDTWASELFSAPRPESDVLEEEIQLPAESANVQSDGSPAEEKAA